jgi:DNA primase
MSAIDDVKQRIDIVEVIGQYTKLSKAGKTFRALCPFHQEKNPSFYVYPEQQSWHCFGVCNTGGDVFSFVMRKQGIDFGEALRDLAGRAGVVLPARPEPGGDSTEKPRVFEVNKAAAHYFQEQLGTRAGEKARSYATGRGLSPQTLLDFQLGYSPDGWEGLKLDLTGKDVPEAELLNAGLIIKTEAGQTHDRFRHKLMFPIADIRGRITGFGARVLDDSLPKYINSPQTPVFDKSGTLYGINLASEAIRGQELAVIVEGYMDVIVAHQYGFKNVVATMGTAVTEKQINIMKKLTPNIAFALDADAAGDEATLRSLGFENTLGVRLSVIILPRGKDPDEVIKADAAVWQGLVAAAIPIVDFAFQAALVGLDLNKTPEKSLVVDRLLPLVAGIEDPIRQAHYLQKLAQLLKVSERTVEAALARLKSKSIRAKAVEPPIVKPALGSFLSSPVEEYCLALLLHYPDLRKQDEGLMPEHFENSENQEIFIAWRNNENTEAVKAGLAPEIREHLDRLLNRELLSDRIEQKYTGCVLDLKAKYLRSRLRKIEAVLTHEAESGGSAAELTKLRELDNEDSRRLTEVLACRKQMRLEQRGSN